MPIDDAFEEMIKADEAKALERMKREEELRKKTEADYFEYEKKAEEFKKFAKGIDKNDLEEAKKMLEKYRKELENDQYDPQERIIKSYLKSISKNWPAEPKYKTDVMIARLISDPEFATIYKEALILSSPVKRIEYLTMKLLEKEICTIFDSGTELFVRLSPLGLNLTCPYFKLEKKDYPASNKEIPFDKCLIDGDEVFTLCNGTYHICSIFKDRTSKFALGALPYIKPLKIFKAPDLKMNEERRTGMEARLNKEIEKYWREDD